ncbi:MAG: T9SS type A sorting domain-containing protein [Saprospiraceae bacterium]|nr:T9SS type A sorting domain-containing protein [Saprospiraceae bacterium]
MIYQCGISLTLLAFFSLQASAQYKWAPVGAKWYVNELAYVSGYSDPNLWNKFYLVECTGDTVVGGYSGRKVGDWIMVQDGYRVHVLWEDTLRLQYDFSLEIGDTAIFQLWDKWAFGYPYQSYSFVVEDIDTITINGQDLKVFHTMGKPNWGDPWSCYCWPYSYMEKLGSLNTIVEEEALNIPTNDHVGAFIRCYEDEELQWKHAMMTLDCDYSKPSHIDESLMGRFQVHPNPARGQVQLELDAYLPHSETLQVRLLHMSGTEMYAGRIPPFAFLHTIPLEGMGSGMYMVEIRDVAGRRLGMQKLVVE